MPFKVPRSPEHGATSQPVSVHAEAQADRIAESLALLARRSPSRLALTRHCPSPSAADLLGSLGYDFSRVRIHADGPAAEVAGILGARAFADRDDVWFGRNELAPHTDAGLRLLSHELVHVARRGFGSVLRRQAITAELLTSVDHTTISDRTSTRDTTSSPQCGWYRQLVPRDGRARGRGRAYRVELGRRSALAAGRTFTEQAIGRMKTHFIANATGPSPASCIGTLNTGLRLLLTSPLSQSRARSRRRWQSSRRGVPAALRARLSSTTPAAT